MTHNGCFLHGPPHGKRLQFTYSTPRTVNSVSQIESTVNRELKSATPLTSTTIFFFGVAHPDHRRPSPIWRLKKEHFLARNPQHDSTLYLGHSLPKKRTSRSSLLCTKQGIIHYYHICQAITNFKHATTAQFMGIAVRKR